MIPTADTTLLSRIIVPLMGTVVWKFYNLSARLAYRMPRGLRRYGYQLALLFGSVAMFIATKWSS